MRTTTFRRAGRAAAVVLAAACLPLAVPAPVGAMTVGAGTASGSVFFGGAGLPPAGAPCGPTGFSLSGSATGVALHTVLSGFVGNVSLWGSGGSSCENAAVGNGLISISAWGIGPTGSTLSCDLHGPYQRLLSEVVLNIVGACYVNSWPAGNVTFAAHAEFAPQDSTQGAITPITSAFFIAEFSVVPI